MLEDIRNGNTTLGIELGSTRIKAVLINSKAETIATGSHEWENQLVDGLWTYSLENVWKGLQECYHQLNQMVYHLSGNYLTHVGSLGISAMMHGYLSFDHEDRLLIPFRTWRNSNTTKAAKQLTNLFHYNIPERWSISHLYQTMLDEEPHTADVSFFTTLAGYIHWQLTGKKVIGIGDASGMFPIDISTQTYHTEMIKKFEETSEARHYDWKLSQILPTILLAGENSGTLSEKGAKLLDRSGNLVAGVPLCPPEGDAGTGMVATNSVGEKTGNISAGTSIFAMIVLEKELKKVHPEIDLVTTPDGKLVGMVHANNGTSDINNWVQLFGEFSTMMGTPLKINVLYEKLFEHALEGSPDAGGLLTYGYHSGENITGLSEGRPLFVANPGIKLTLANFMRAHLMSSMGALKIGMDILVNEEGVRVDEILAHGGFFKTPIVGQKIMAAAMNTPTSVMETAGEGGPWGMALLALFMKNKKTNETLPEFLTESIFSNNSASVILPDPEEVAGFEVFMQRYKAGLPIEESAIKHLN